MCGIFGVLNTQNDRGLEACARALDHRGPDGFGALYRENDGVYLAHCRLAIIDLSNAGQQPMSNVSQSVWLTFNGEIYNFKALRLELERAGRVFRSNTDSEVIIHAYDEWGIECVDQLDGMFAFALWDVQKGKCFLVRDRVGIKPLYFWQQGKKLAFASEPKALIRLPPYHRHVDQQALQSLLIYGYVAGEPSIWQGINRLAPGEILTFDLKKGLATKSKYWELAVERVERSAIEAVEEFIELFSNAVKSHLVSDVPIGVLLSGGLDSTAVASMSAAFKPGMDAISIGFPAPSVSELPAAEESARLLGLNLRQSTLSNAMFEELMPVFSLLDEPLADTSIFPSYLVCREARKYLKVVNSGDGGDELFAGYNWYFQTEYARRLKKLLFRVGDLIGPKLTSKSPRLKRMDRFQHYLLMRFPGFSRVEINALFPDFGAGGQHLDETWLLRSHKSKGSEPFKSWQMIDFHTFLVDNNLVKVDRLSMACSLEVRVPLLDHRLVEFAFSLPDGLCVKDKQSKYVIREYLRVQGLLHVLNQPKRGFSFNVNQYWSLARMVTMLSSSHMTRDGFIHRAALTQTLQNSQAFNYSCKIWLLAVLEMWYRNWFE